MSAPTVAVWVPGKPVPMPRPRVTRFGTYHSKASVDAKRAVVEAWQDAGSPVILEGDLAVRIAVVVPRPPSHLLTDGSLSAAGRRAVRPRGDFDNYAKLATDALNGLAWTDDDQFTSAHVVKQWAPADVAPGLYVVAYLVSAHDVGRCVRMWSAQALEPVAA